MDSNRRGFLKNLSAATALTLINPNQALAIGAGPAFWKKRTSPVLNKKIVFLNSAITTSTLVYDGTTFTTGTLPISSSWTGIAHNGSVFCAIAGTGNTAATSVDGVTWTARTLSFSSNYWGGVHWNGTYFLAYASSTNLISYSADGITWASATLPATNAWFNIASGGGKTVLITDEDYPTAYSSDGGLTWTAGTMDPTQWYSLVWSGSLFMTHTHDFVTQSYQTSPDGITWTLRSMPVAKKWTSAIARNGIVYVFNSTDNSMAYSADGINWTQTTTTTGGRGIPYTLNLWNGERFISGNATAGTVTTSTDGVTWSTITLPSANWIRAASS